MLFFMNRILLFWGIIILFGCSSAPKPNFPAPNKADIDEIVATVLAKDSLFDFIHKPLSIDLKKIQVYKSDTSKFPPPPSFSSIFIDNLLKENNYKQKPFSHPKIFSPTDSAYLFFQNDTLKKLKINSKLPSGLKLTNTMEVLKKRELKEFYPFITISIPLLSLNQKKAYLEIDDHCNMCGGGWGVILEKINGHWKILKVFTTYMT